MSRPPRVSLLPVLLALIVVAGCSRPSAPTAPSEPPPEPQAGWLAGAVSVVSPCGGIVRDGSGIVVSLEGTDLSTTTDASGAWRFENLPFGYYDLSFSKQGLSNFKALHYHFTRSERARLSWFSGLCELPAGVVSNLAAETASSDGAPGVRVTFDVTPACPGGPFQALLVLGDDKTVGADHYVISSGIQSSDDGHFDLFYRSSGLEWNGLFRGSRLYVRAYDARKFGYWDHRIQTWVYTAVSVPGSVLASCVVP